MARMWTMAGASAAALLTASAAQAGDHGWKTASDVGVAALVAAAFADSTAQRDWRGDEQLALSLGATGLATYGLKQAFPERRPNGRNDESFPSGHTSVSFAAAGYLQGRYGWRTGLPAVAAAAQARIEHADLAALLYVQGYRREDFAA